MTRSWLLGNAELPTPHAAWLKGTVDAPLPPIFSMVDVTEGTSNTISRNFAASASCYGVHHIHQDGTIPAARKLQ